MMLSFLSAAEGDIPVIFAQARDLIVRYEDAAAIDLREALAWTERKIAKHLHEYIRVARNGETCAFVRRCADGELDDLYVLPQFRGQGIGSAVLVWCLKQTTVPPYFYVFTRNIRAIALYRRFGFELCESVSPTRAIMRMSF